MFSVGPFTRVVFTDVGELLVPRNHAVEPAGVLVNTVFTYDPRYQPPLALLYRIL